MNIGNSSFAHIRRKLENVTASGILDPHLRVCVRKLTSIARMFEMFE